MVFPLPQAWKGPFTPRQRSSLLAVIRKINTAARSNLFMACKNLYDHYGTNGEIPFDAIGAGGCSLTAGKENNSQPANP
jgi:uncharacterized protein YkwD